MGSQPRRKDKARVGEGSLGEKKGYCEGGRSGGGGMKGARFSKECEPKKKKGGKRIFQDQLWGGAHVVLDPGRGESYQKGGMTLGGKLFFGEHLGKTHRPKARALSVCADWGR